MDDPDDEPVDDSDDEPDDEPDDDAELSDDEVDEFVVSDLSLPAAELLEPPALLPLLEEPRLSFL